MAGTVAPNIVTDGLVFYVDAANTKSYVSGSTTWADIVAGNNVTLINGPIFTSANSGGIIYDGTNDYSAAGTSETFNITGNLTVCAWVRPTGSFSTQGNIVSKNGNAGYRMRFQSNGTFWIYANGNTITSPLSYSLNNWYHTTAAFTSSGLRMYINGNLLNSNSTPFNPSYSIPSNFYIGAVNATGGELFRGTVSMVNLYNRALNINEVRQNYNSTKTRFGLT